MLRVIMNMNDCSLEEAKELLVSAVNSAREEMNSGTSLEEAVEQVKEEISVYESDWDMKIAQYLCYGIAA